MLPCTGSGSTFDAPFFSAAFPSYQQQHPGVTIGYAAVGSSAGIAAISAQQVNFGASDVPMTASEQAAAKGGPITQVPVDLDGEGVAYNLSLLRAWKSEHGAIAPHLARGSSVVFGNRGITALHHASFTALMST